MEHSSVTVYFISINKIMIIFNLILSLFLLGKLLHKDLDDRALDALKEFPSEGAVAVLNQFLESNLEHVSNKSAFLCGIMKTYRQKSRSGLTGVASTSAITTMKGPDEEKIKVTPQSRQLKLNSFNVGKIAEVVIRVFGLSVHAQLTLKTNLT